MLDVNCRDQMIPVLRNPFACNGNLPMLILHDFRINLFPTCSFSCCTGTEESSLVFLLEFRWVMYMEKSICECDNKLLVYHESLKRLKKR